MVSSTAVIEYSVTKRFEISSWSVFQELNRLEAPWATFTKDQKFDIPNIGELIVLDTETSVDYDAEHEQHVWVVFRVYYVNGVSKIYKAYGEYTSYDGFSIAYCKDVKGIQKTVTVWE